MTSTVLDTTYDLGCLDWPFCIFRGGGRYAKTSRPSRPGFANFVGVDTKFECMFANFNRFCAYCMHFSVANHSEAESALMQYVCAFCLSGGGEYKESQKHLPINESQTTISRQNCDIHYSRNFIKLLKIIADPRFKASC